ncbi:MAG: mechanosensitive ion channel [Candidatus Omnitrophica bacterium]|nr:mechanosensitive ion channel [Candidatus Omnitrophota bacterium]
MKFHLNRLHRVAGVVFFSSFISFGRAVAETGTQVVSAAPAVKEMFNAHVATAQKLFGIAAEFLVKYSFQALGGIIVIIAGFFVANIACRFTGEFLHKHRIDVTISKFLLQIIKIAILALAVLIALGNFGITIAPFIAGLSVAGFGLSFALQGPLSNYAAGATLIFTKPFKVGDIIEVVNVLGEVEDMTLARTQVRTIDGTTVMVPNKHIIGEIIHNYSEHKKVDIKVGVAYGTDIDKATKLVKEIAEKDARVAKNPAPRIGILEFADSSIIIYAQLWTKQTDYWQVLFDVNKAINETFRSGGISMPFPQRDVHIIGGKI